MTLDESAVRQLPLEQLEQALRRWFEHTGDAIPSQLLAQMAAYDEPLHRRAVLLLKIRRFGPVAIPDTTSTLAVSSLEDARSHDPYPRGRRSRPIATGGTNA